MPEGELMGPQFNRLMPEPILSLPPDDPDLRQRCQSHIDSDRLGTLMDEYVWTKQAPEAVTARIACEGVGGLCLRQCHMRVDQLDARGEVLTSFRIDGK